MRTLSALRASLIFLLLAAMSPLAHAAEGGIDQKIQAAIKPIADFVAETVFYAIPMFGQKVPWILFWLILIGLFSTIYFKFINIRGLSQGFRIIRGDYTVEDDGHGGEANHFQALATALSGTVGLGNIAGVAAAIAMGGPGATFWMIVAAFLGMSTKFVECTLAVKYRNELPDGSVSGGPMYYLSKGISEQYPKMKWLGALMGILFAVVCLFGAMGSGNLFQVNQAYSQLLFITGGEESFMYGKAWVFGAVMAVAVGVVIIGGMKRIGRVAGKLVPMMAAIYLLAAFVVIFANIEHIPDAFGAIFKGAFTGEGVAGGVLGAILTGFRRAAFSNEAGIGSAPIAHASVKTSEPMTEGLVALWEPLIDTIVICTITALVIIVSGAYVDTSAEGVQLTSNAFATVMPWFPYVLAVVVMMFAYSTMIAYGHYGTKAATYLFGEKKSVEITYKLIYVSMAIVGVTLDFSQLIDFADAIYFTLAVPNVIGLYLLAPVVKRELASYRKRLAAGEIKATREYVDEPFGSP